MSVIKTGYMCITDFEEELEFASGGVPVYSSIEDIKKERKCVEECGIIMVRVEKYRVVQPPNWPSVEEMKL